MSPRSAAVGVVIALVWTGVAVAADPHAVVLLYHRFGEDRYPSTSVDLERFEAHLDYLAEGGFSVLPLADVVAAIRDGTELPDRTVVITVDDAYRSVYQEAYPRLRKRGWPFTVFVSTGGVDQGLDAYMSWDQMREMRARGATFANHTATHESMIEGSEREDPTARMARLRGDVERAQQRLEEEIGEAPALFAYPYGEYDETVADMVVEMGYVPFGQQSGPIGRHIDARALPRFPMAGPYADLDQFRVKVSALPFPVTDQEPFDPVTTSRRPRLEVTLGESDAILDELRCFVGGQGAVRPEWIEPGRRFAVRAAEDLPAGRGRYNCTAPNRARSRYYWFSRQWVVKP
jgi:peptidoglycan/xylan/chitin deacetylase (PgdA/CDA1 family)